MNSSENNKFLTTLDDHRVKNKLIYSIKNDDLRQGLMLNLTKYSSFPFPPPKITPLI